jgi:hypothetical protein
MKRFLPLALFLLLAIVAVAHAQGPGISYPPETETLRALVSIQGTANHPDFWKYELAAAPFGTQNFFDLAGAEAPVIAGVLGQWDTRAVPDGPYTLRLRVVRRDGNYDEYFVVRVQVANAGPPPTPTGQVTPTPTVTPTPKPATATPVVLTPQIPTPTPAPSATATVIAGDVGGNSGDSDSDGEGESAIASLVTRISSLGDAFVRGGGAVLLVFLAIGVFFGVKHLLTWLYYRLLAGR